MDNIFSKKELAFQEPFSTSGSVVNPNVAISRQPIEITRDNEFFKGFSRRVLSENKNSPETITGILGQRKRQVH